MMTTAPAPAKDPAPAIRGFLLLDGFFRFTLWQSSLALTIMFFNWLEAWPTFSPLGSGAAGVWKWCERLGHAVLVFNVVYLLLLVGFRVLIPKPREGRFNFVGGGGFNVNLVWTSLIALIVRARYQPTFPAFLVVHLANLPPFHWLVRWTIGPKSKSVFVLDPPLPDPDFLEIGRNVTIGYSTSIIAHNHDREGVTVKKVIVEDDVMIGAESLIYGGCVIKRGSVIYGGAVVAPYTVIGENEAWGGVPARKIKDLPPVGSS